MPNKYDLLKNSPIFPNQVFENLPPLIKLISDQFTDNRERDMVLTSTLVVLGGCFANITGKYRHDWVNPNLFAFIVAPPASGKGVIKYSQNLGKEIQYEYSKQNSDARKKYKAAMKKYEAEQKRFVAEVHEEPIKPKCPVLFIPGNSSSAAIYKHLADGDGIGIIFETEADSMTSAIRQQWGDFSPLLRAAFQHEVLSKSRVIDEEYIVIRNPRLAAMLSGTPDQVARLISSTEDGLFSRFLFYCFARKPEWTDPSVFRSSENLADQFVQHAKTILDVKNKFQSEKFTFEFTKDQFNRMTPVFNKKLEQIGNFEGEGAISVVFRLGLMSFKIGMILTVVRNIEQLDVNKNLVCSDTDFETTMNLTDVFFEHSMIMYSLLPKESSKGTSPKLRQFYAALPENEEFSRSQANEIGKSVGISERTYTII